MSKKKEKIQASEIEVGLRVERAMDALAEQCKKNAASSAEAEERSARARDDGATALQTIADLAEQHPDVLPNSLAFVRRLRESGSWPQGPVRREENTRRTIMREIQEENEEAPAIAWDIRREGRAWTEEEYPTRADRLIELKLETRRGKLFFREETRLLLLGMLLENVGIDAAIRLGDLAAWKEAIAAAEQNALFGSVTASP